MNQFSKESIDKNTPVPMYYQLKKIILDMIREGKLKPGDMIPLAVIFPACQLCQIPGVIEIVAVVRRGSKSESAREQCVQPVPLYRRHSPQMQGNSRFLRILYQQGIPWYRASPFFMLTGKPNR